jgi:hypothetical protein
MTSVNSPTWSDDELLWELGAALREPAVDESSIRAAQAMFTWRTMDADLELLLLPRMLVFSGERMRVEINIGEAGIAGQLIPPRPGWVTLVASDGRLAITRADDVGCFAFPPPAAGPLRLACRLGDDHFSTGWVIS